MRSGADVDRASARHGRGRDPLRRSPTSSTQPGWRCRTSATSTCSRSPERSPRQPTAPGRLGNLATTVVGIELVTGTVRSWCATTRRSRSAAGRPRRRRRTRCGHRGDDPVCAGLRLHARETIEQLDDVLADSTRSRAAPTTPSSTGCPAGGAVRSSATNAPTSRRARSHGSRMSATSTSPKTSAFGAMSCRAPLPLARAIDRQGRRGSVVRTRPRRSQRSRLHQPAPCAVRRDGVRRAARRPGRGGDRVRHLTQTLSYPVLFPIEVRVSAADDIPLSTGFGRENGWVAVHQYRGAPYEAYFQGVERIMDDYGGRPHWGKLHFQTAATFARALPRVGCVRPLEGGRRPSRNLQERLPGSCARAGRDLTGRVTIRKATFLKSDEHAPSNHLQEPCGIWKRRARVYNDAPAGRDVPRTATRVKECST